jgi:hypothetical protein
MIDTITSQNIDLSSWDTLYTKITKIKYPRKRNRYQNKFGNERVSWFNKKVTK